MKHLQFLKRAVSMLLVVVLVVSMVPVQVLADDNGGTPVPYVTTQDSAAGALTEQQKLIYQEAKKQIQEIAAGVRDYAVLQINVQDALGITDLDQYDAALSELGLTDADFDADGNASINADIAWQNWAEGKGYFDYYSTGGGFKVIHALQNACAYDMYWVDDAMSTWPITVVKKEGGKVGLSEASYVPITMDVASTYRATTQRSNIFTAYYPNHYWDVDTAKTQAVAQAVVPAAQKIVAENAGKSDYEKLVAYKDFILAHADFSSYSGSEEVLDIFRGTTEASVKAEGYAKAFKFLCDMTTFEDETIDARLVAGSVSGRSGNARYNTKSSNMWNLVTVGGKNYIVDLPNCEEGTPGVFLAYATDSVVSTDMGNVRYAASSSGTNDSYAAAVLVVSDTALELEQPNPVQQENTWTTALSCGDITEGEKLAPTAAAQYGEVVFTYAAEEDGTYTDTVPTAAGTYWVKAAVAETEAYTGLEAKVSFAIKAKPVVHDPITPKDPGEVTDAAAQNLSDSQKLIYAAAKKQLHEIAAGEREDTILRISLKDDLGMDVYDEKYSVSLEDCGAKASDFNDDGTIKNYNPMVAWMGWAEKQGYFDYYNSQEWMKINHALWEGCANDLYWCDKAVQGFAVWPATVVLKDGMVCLPEDSYIPIATGARKEYRVTKSTDDYFSKFYSNSRFVDTTKTAAEYTATMANVQAVVDQYKDLSDMEKLVAYRDYILDAVSYDNSAATLVGQAAEPTDAFFITNVFDGQQPTEYMKKREPLTVIHPLRLGTKKSHTAGQHKFEERI